ncbi:MAG: RecQ family ATP-dependent DNA helicase [Rhodobacteraceae bacterium]|nr:RecQ family ATP-dependent DNA helicase [Paracoccaceae bacterium]
MNSEVFFFRRCLSLDLEVNPGTAQTFAFAAVPGDGASAFVVRGGGAREWDRLERLVAGYDHLIGHNILRHDVEHLIANRPQIAAAIEAPIDTLWLNPLAFPRNPYHRLVKHYQDGRLQSGHVNDPEMDAKLVFDVLRNQLDAFATMHADRPDLVLAYHFLTTRTDRAEGFDAVFTEVRAEGRPTVKEAVAAIMRLLDGKVCAGRLVQTIDRLERARPLGWPMAYALSWIQVAGGDSVMPPWVRAQFPEAALIVQHLRDNSCRNPACGWCAEMADPTRALDRWFGFPSFRAEPTDDEGRPLQERIVDEAMNGASLLGILPTGTGKSICYQIPALSRFDRTGALTVVISPLVALMADQVQGMERAGISSAVTVNGMLSMPERQDALDKVRLGEAAMLIISPEQLRSVSVQSVLRQREIGLWVIDEAHCISKWGHDFRPDYRYVSRFIKEQTGADAPILCLTATAKPDVVKDIRDHFRERLNVDLQLFDGGASRENLDFVVRSTTRETKLSDILDAIADGLPSEGASGAVVYCSTRGETQRVAEFLETQGLAAAYFHAGLTAEVKKDVQERFRIGELRVIAATNAFGMGIDKPDIRVVVHGDIPGSLENYLQEAGRAGRDRDPARCILLFAPEDVERQFSLTARSRLARHEIGAILRALRQIDEKTRRSGIVVATSGEILREERDREFVRDTSTDDTRIKTAVAWLEEAGLASREENRVRIFPSSLTVRSVEDARRLIAEAHPTAARRNELLAIATHLMNAPADEGISTDELCGVSGLTPSQLPSAMAELERLRVAKNDMGLTAFIHVGVEGQSRMRLEAAASLESALIGLMQEEMPDADPSSELAMHLSEVCQRLRDDGHEAVRPDLLEKLLRGMTKDGRGYGGAKGNVRLRKPSRNTLVVSPQRDWRLLIKVARLRALAGKRILEHLSTTLPKGSRGKDLQVESAVGDLVSVLLADMELASAGIEDMTKMLERALLWMHEQAVLTLGKGLTVFRPAITVHMSSQGGKFTQEHFRPLEAHYAEQTVQTHVMAAYAEAGLSSQEKANKLSEDYFTNEKDRFLSKWLPGKTFEMRRQTSGASWKAIVEGLGNPIQQEIVADDREETSVLVLAGPGSGKTRVLVHRVAYLLRVRRENPLGILVLTYNRHAATEVRSRLRALVGDDANGVTICTCHALAMRLIGASFADAAAEAGDFDTVLAQATDQLQGDGLSRSEAEAHREALLSGYRWILVDEYQDIGKPEYDFISAVAGRSIEDRDQKLSLFAVGDDDQNIYSFRGASVDYIRRFSNDYLTQRGRPSFLVENYRSTRNIVDASNAVIRRSAERMKADHEIVVNRNRTLEPAGGAMAAADPVAQGRVQVLRVPPGDDAQAVAAVDEMLRLSQLDPDWDWNRTGIIAREWQRLGPVWAYASKKNIRSQFANEKDPSLWRLREMRGLVKALKSDPTAMIDISGLLKLVGMQGSGRWIDTIAMGIADLGRAIGTRMVPTPEVIEWLAEWARDARGEQRGLLLLTAHRAKGLEFDHVIVLDGGWDRQSAEEDPDASRRLFYVAMTRARRTLAAITSRPHWFIPTDEASVIERRLEVKHCDLNLMGPIPSPITMSDVDLSYAGRLGHRNVAHVAISQLNVGDPLEIRRIKGRWDVFAGNDVQVGRMAKSWSPRTKVHSIATRVGALIQWRRADCAEAFQSQMQRDVWEVVLPELELLSSQTEDVRSQRV